jgi:hypothetical protein
MMKKYILPVVLAGLVLATSCSKTLETKSVNSADANITKSQAAGVEAILNSAFNTLQGATYYGRDLIVVPELLSDNMRIVSSNSNRFTNEANNVNGSTIALWQNAYIAINKLNGVIKYADPATGFTDVRRKQVKGEAYFLRAMTYFDLVKVYAYNPRFVIAAQDRGGVPIVLDYVENFPGDITYPARATTAAVYTQIKADLTLALSLLDNTQGAIHPNKAAAYGLLSRVNLYLGEWQECVDNSTKAINEGLATFVEASTGAAATAAEKSAAYKTIWTTPSSKESLFELNYEATESLGSDALSSFYTKNTLGVPSTSGAGYGDAAPQANLVAAYEAGDVRKDLLFQIVKGSETILWNQKYPGLKSPQVDNVKLIRISEMYLNRAEANVQLNTPASLASALLDLNKIRVRAGLAPAVAATFANVFAERRVELAYEGQRYFDLLRTGSDINKSSNTLPASTVYSTTIPYSDFRLLARIPIGEVSVNPNLKQNFGY